MQFLQATFDAVVAAHPPPPGGAHPPSRYHPHDAIWAAGAYLCDSGAPERLDEALFAYNHSRQYVADVLARAAAYRAALPANPATGAGASVAGRIALDYARGQIGLPYLWVDGPEAGEAGFDCSGLVTAAYAAAGVDLPRTAHTQYHATARVTEADLQPGDLVFYGNPDTKIHHVGLYLGNGQMIDAPTYGKPVGMRPIRRPGDDFAGGGRVVEGQ